MSRYSPEEIQSFEKDEVLCKLQNDLDVYKKAIDEIEDTLNEIEGDCEKHRHYSDVDQGWIEGLGYALSVVRRKLNKDVV